MEYWKKIKNRKVAGFDKITAEVWKTRKFDDVLRWLCNIVYKQNAASESLRNINVELLLQ